MIFQNSIHTEPCDCRSNSCNKWVSFFTPLTTHTTCDSADKHLVFLNGQPAEYVQTPEKMLITDNKLF